MEPINLWIVALGLDSTNCMISLGHEPDDNFMPDPKQDGGSGWLQATYTYFY
jgi:hypothetical protein